MNAVRMSLVMCGASMLVIVDVAVLISGRPVLTCTSWSGSQRNSVANVVTDLRLGMTAIERLTVVD